MEELNLFPESVSSYIATYVLRNTVTILMVQLWRKGPMPNGGGQ